MMSGMLALPEDCIETVISFTSPRDACRMACVSTAFRSVAHSDTVWDRFLPPEYLSAISNASFFSRSSSSTWSKKELYLRNCHHHLIHNGRLSFWLDRPSGKKCYMIPATELDIDGFDFEWNWVSVPEARFPEVALLIGTTWFEIIGKISTSLLSPMTTYAAYLVFKAAEFDYFDRPVEVSVGLAGSDVQKRTVYISPGNGDGFFAKERGDGWVESYWFEKERGYGWFESYWFAKERGDGWFESYWGEFLYGGGDAGGELSMSILGENKQGLLVQGIEIRPRVIL